MNFVTLHDENGLEIDVNMDLVCTMQRDVFNLYTKIRFIGERADDATVFRAKETVPEIKAIISKQHGLANTLSAPSSGPELKHSSPS